MLTTSCVIQHPPHRRRYRRPQCLLHIQPHTPRLRSTQRFARELNLQRRDVQLEMSEGVCECRQPFSIDSHPFRCARTNPSLQPHHRTAADTTTRPRYRCRGASPAGCHCRASATRMWCVFPARPCADAAWAVRCTRPLCNATQSLLHRALAALRLAARAQRRAHVHLRLGVSGDIALAAADASACCQSCASTFLSPAQPAMPQ